MDLGSAYAAGGAADALQEIVKQRLLEQQQANQEAQQAFERQMRTQENARAEKEQADREASTKWQQAKDQRDAALKQFEYMSGQPLSALEDPSKPGQMNAQTGLGGLANALPNTDLFAHTTTAPTAVQPQAATGPAPVVLARKTVTVPGIGSVAPMTLTPQSAEDIASAKASDEYTKAKIAESVKDYTLAPGAKLVNAAGTTLATGGEKEETDRLSRWLAAKAAAKGSPLTPQETQAAIAEDARLSQDPNYKALQEAVLGLTFAQKNRELANAPSDADVERWSDMLADPNHPASLNDVRQAMSQAGKMGEGIYNQIIMRTRQKNPSFNLQAAEAQSRTNLSPETQQKIENLNQLDTALTNLETASKQFPRTPWSTPNQLWGWAANTFGNEGAAKLQSDTEMVRGLIPTLGLKNQKEIDQTISSGMGGAKMQTAIDTLRAQSKAMRDAISKASGQTSAGPAGGSSGTAGGSVQRVNGRLVWVPDGK